MRAAVPLSALLMAPLLAGLGACARRPAPPSAAATAPAPDAVEVPAGETRARPGTAIALLYASNLQGEYEHCGCPSHPLGGLVRRATVIDRARADSDGVVIVDAGDMLMPPPSPAPSGDGLRFPPPAEILRRARLVLGAYARMGVHAVLPGEGDLVVGPLVLKQLLRTLGVPAVASNLVDAGGRAVFDQDRIIEIAGIRIGIFGVVAPLPEHEALWRGWDIRATEPAAAARAEVASLKARGATMIIALLHLGPIGAARKLLEETPGIDWAVLGHSGMQLETPDTGGGARLLEAMTMGKLAGRLDIHVVDGTGRFSDRGERAQVVTIMADHRGQLADLERRAAEDKTEQLRDYYRMRREGLTAAIERDARLIKQLPTVVAGNWYQNRIIPLDESIPDHPAITQMVAAYNRENVRRAGAGLPVGIAVRNAPIEAPPAATSGPVTARGAATLTARGDTSSAPLRYAGSAACAGCHRAAWSVFQATKHAHALASLAPTKRQRDPTCVGCHSTGFMLPGGPTSVRVATNRLKDVGCEACHGPSLEHATSAESKGTTPNGTTRREVDERICRGCHTPDQTNGEFDYKAFRRAILGPGHGG